MPTLAVDDRRLSYEDYGSGPVALLIHGSPGNAKAWARVGEPLAARYRIIAADLPGYGETTPQPPGGEPYVEYASELVEALTRYVGTPAVLAGHSYGGVVALALALRGPVSIGALD
jgi:pimeloyl-ACP methyl ester carboxylesterase